MEAINHVLAQEISKLVSETPEARAGVMDGLSIDPSEVIEATEHEHTWDQDGDTYRCSGCGAVDAWPFF